MNSREIWELFCQIQQSVGESKPPEFRLYYDDAGNVITYSTEDLPDKKYIIVSKEQYAESRPDVKVIDGKIVETHNMKVISKLTRNASDGSRCSKYDVNIIVDDTDPNFSYWKNQYYEL